MSESVRRRLTTVYIALFAPVMIGLSVAVAWFLHGPYLILLGAAAAVTLVAALAMTWTLNVALRPLDGLTEGAQAMAAGYLDRRVPEGNDEFGRLGLTLNHMASSLSMRLNELAESRDRLGTVISYMASGVLLVDSAGRVVLANAAAQQMTGMTDDDLGRNHVAVLRHYDLSNAITTALTASRESRVELTLRQAAVEAVLAPVQGRGVVAVLHDVTERRRVDQMRRDFVANVSHELKTPVTAVKGFAETLLGGALDEPETARQFVEIMHKEATRMSSLIADLLDLAKLESEPGAIRKAPTDVVALVRGLMARMEPRARELGVGLEADVARMTADIDPVRLEQVLVNLIDNSLKHTPRGGTIAVRLREDGSHLTGQVSDTGVGIPGDAVGRIFERFYRVDQGRARKTGGTGLGLAIAKHIVEAHGGHIAATSMVGKGTTITFTVPLTTR